MSADLHQERIDLAWRMKGCSITALANEMSASYRVARGYKYIVDYGLKQKTPLTPTHWVEIQKRRTAGESHAQISASLGWSPSSLTYWLKTNDPDRPTGVSCQSPIASRPIALTSRHRALATRWV